MNIYEFGLENEQILLIFHGSCMSWDMFKDDIDLLKKHYHIIIPALPGHDLKNNSNYTMPIVIPELKTQIQYWYGTVEKKQRKLDIAYVKKVFTSTKFVQLENLGHGEFGMRYPKEFTKKVQVFLNS